jgi:putative ABC transport system permease protein
MFTLAIKSIRNRRFTTILTIISIALSVTLLLGVERIRKEARAGFTNTISGTDLIVGARSGPVQLLLYSVFRIGNATNNICWQSYQEIARNPNIQWTIPISLGDSHKGCRVLGTNADYFEGLIGVLDKTDLAGAVGQDNLIVEAVA